MSGDPEFVREPAIVEFGGPEPTRPSWILPVIGALAVGLALGFLLGRQQQKATPAARPTSTVVDPIVATGRTCASTLAGADLQLGVQIRNQSGQPVVLEKPGVELPLGGLWIVTQPAAAACGELSAAANPAVLQAGASTWLSVRLHVPGGDCPAALPVRFNVYYLVGTERDRADVGGFSDLGNVPYPSCTP
ncbi:MAG TPA: hypothetical protein VGP57_13545 [Actinoplanes sp.]|nr:hypothetical protein [Actinoplanes sp.]